MDPRYLRCGLNFDLDFGSDSASDCGAGFGLGFGLGGYAVAYGTLSCGTAMQGRAMSHL